MFDIGHSLNETNETHEPKQKEQFKKKVYYQGKDLSPVTVQIEEKIIKVQVRQIF